MISDLKKIFFVLFLSFTLSSLSAQIPVMSFDEFEPMLHQNNDTAYVVNFWATWCKPCVKEIPAFEKLNQKYADKPVKVLMVSLDFLRNLNDRLIPFVEQRNMKSDIVLLNDPKSHIWIEKVSEDWSGAIPATLIYSRNNRSFFERAFTFEELEAELLKHL